MTHTQIKASISLKVNELKSELEIAKEDLETLDDHYFFKLMYNIQLLKKTIHTLEGVRNIDDVEIDPYIHSMNDRIIKDLIKDHNPSSSMFTEIEYKLERDAHRKVYSILCSLLNLKSII